jgi:hypothetical protein
MADHVRISQQQSQPLALRGPGSAGQPAGLNGYGRQGQAQTSPSQPMATEEFQRAVAKLNRTLDSGTELRTNVPRGFYLNIRV